MTKRSDRDGRRDGGDVLRRLLQRRQGAAEGAGDEVEATQVAATLEHWDQLSILDRFLLATGLRDDLLDPDPDAEAEQQRRREQTNRALAATGFGCPICREPFHLGACRSLELAPHLGAGCPLCGRPFHAGPCPDPAK